LTGLHTERHNADKFSRDLSDEADLSAQPVEAQAAPRLSHAHGNAGRPQGAGPPPRAGPQEAFGLTKAGDGRLRRRADFLAANAGGRFATPGFILLVRRRDDGEDGFRVGFTVTKRIGGSVVRNRLKRRLRAIARDVLPEAGIPGADHVLIGREAGVTRDFAAMRLDLARALRRLAA